VLEGIERLGYRPNLAARDLRQGQTHTVLAVVPKLSAFFLEVFRGAEQAADELGFVVLMANARGDIKRQMAYFDQVASRRADGIILLTGALPPARARPPHGLPPLVLAVEPIADSQLPAIAVDHAGGAQEAVRHLVNLGHKRIAHIAGLDHVLSARLRLAGYREALKQARVPFDEALIHRGDFTFGSGHKAMQALMRQRPRPTAVFCANDEMAVGAIRAVTASGLKVPHDLSVVGFDDQDFAEIYDPPLSTVHMPRFDVGYQAMMLLAKVISAESLVKSMLLPTRLVIRATSSAPRRR
jgi:LacI family transcriptional regulator, repressor for deo operon, udp, cdd, tsx, nupC, and nupG